MGPSLAELADRALDEVRRLGVPYADVRAVREDAESVDVRDDRIEAVSRESSRGVGIRVLIDGAWGFAATSTLDPAAIRATAAQAVDIARASGHVRGGSKVRLDDTPAVSGSYTTPHLRDPLEVPLAEKAAYLLAATAAAREADGIAYAEATTDAWRKRTAFRSTDGGRIEQTVLQVGGGLSAWAIGEGEVQNRSYPNSFRGQFVTGGWEAVLALDLVGHALGTALEAVALLTAPELPFRDDATVVLESSQLALQVHESVGHPLELDRILGMERAFSGTSFVDVDDR